MERRHFVTLVGGAALIWPARSLGQQSARVWKIGYLGFGEASSWTSEVEAFRAGLRELGYVEGRNLKIDFQWAERVDQTFDLAKQLVDRKVDVIFAPASTQVGPARRATATIPIVFAQHADPVGLGDVTSLSRPGGNITGMSMLLTEVSVKELEILKEILPGATRVGLLWNPTTPSHPTAVRTVEGAAHTLGVELVPVSASTVSEVQDGFLTMARDQCSGVLVLSSPLYTVQAELVAELQMRHRLPAMFANRANVKAGGLVSYGADLDDLYRRAAFYIDKIFRGATPADLPVEQASKYFMVLNLKTARALGLNVSPTLLTRADEVIE
ncbi:hypothetical protein XH98_06595 [Bradyrhizobium sp. CCBAU 51745]|uniref:ABC transporter substrate-binding protein n=1 Tax=Bradyrhizobium sp. CCBAU 51745 TaxID=1325099 RepID=UPI0023066270|nr:ABC transporter substrate-binding protein [Bradyrhizobium sp. CCBAU 51745]MDA9438792.1 hypothetical protein [Bradyrhizobium sp. CCBAU 51745]